MQSSVRGKVSSQGVYHTVVGFRHVGGESKGLQELCWRQVEDAGVSKEGSIFVLGDKGFP